MPINLKEGDRYVVNHGEGLTTIDFGSYVSLAEKEGTGMTEVRHGAHAAKRMEHKMSLDSKGYSGKGGRRALGRGAKAGEEGELLVEEVAKATGRCNSGLQRGAMVVAERLKQRRKGEMATATRLYRSQCQRQGKQR
ncbi:hypothetical protein BHE74_00047197 [Ensete ventricosum]|nr:hypothetical protein BHE74_00047197 [Ensete ventricosum]